MAKKPFETGKKFGGHMLSIMLKDELRDHLLSGMTWMEIRKQLVK